MFCLRETGKAEWKRRHLSWVFNEESHVCLEESDRKGNQAEEMMQVEVGRWVQGNIEKFVESGYQGAGAQGCSGLLSPPK